MIKFIVAALGISPTAVAYVAYTGKAAQILVKKGCPNATTAHRLLYKSVQMSDGTFKHFPRRHIFNYKVIVVDEVSMLPKDMWELLLSHKIYVIACGDPFQLPAIFESCGVLDHPHIFLDEIMRQAADSEIIRLATDIRNGKSITRPYKGEEINIVPRSELSDGMFKWADQIICAKNATRREFNQFYREMKWGNKDISPSPIVGDKVICLKNSWDRALTSSNALVNGTIGTVMRISTSSDRHLGTKCTIDFLPEDCDEMFGSLPIDWKLITTGAPTINKENFRKIPKKKHPEQFDYGYVITAWKAQGGEWDKVLFIAEKTRFMDKEEYLRYLYTGCTRGSKKLTVVI